jgi:hypothetical protein
VGVSGEVVGESQNVDGSGASTTEDWGRLLDMTMLDLGLMTGLLLLLVLAALPLRNERTEGTGFKANSCAPGVGGVKKDEDGDGKGDTVAESWRETDRRR